MKACARAGGAVTTAAAATAAAINFEIMNIIPPDWAGKLDGAGPGVNPSHRPTGLRQMRLRGLAAAGTAVSAVMAIRCLSFGAGRPGRSGRQYLHPRSLRRLRAPH